MPSSNCLLSTKHLCQKLLKLNNACSSYSEKCRGCFLRQCISLDIPWSACLCWTRPWAMQKRLTDRNSDSVADLCWLKQPCVICECALIGATWRTRVNDPCAAYILHRCGWGEQERRYQSRWSCVEANSNHVRRRCTLTSPGEWDGWSVRRRRCELSLRVL